MYHRSILRAVLNYKINIVIKVLIFSDFMIFAASNLLAPIFAIFIIDRIDGAGLETVGLCAAIYFISKAICELPVGRFIDKTRSEKDDLYTAILGTILTAVVYLAYIFITATWQLYVSNIILGMGAALAYPGWYSIFTRHVDSDKKGVEWSLFDVMVGIGMSISAALGAFIADYYGFNVLFVIIFIFTVAGALLLLSIRNKIYTK